MALDIELDTGLKYSVSAPCHRGTEHEAKWEVEPGPDYDPGFGVGDVEFLLPNHLENGTIRPIPNIIRAAKHEGHLSFQTLQS